MWIEKEIFEMAQVVAGGGSAASNSAADPDEDSPEFRARQAAFFAKASAKRAAYQAGASDFHKKREEMNAALSAEFGDSVTVTALQEEHQREMGGEGTVPGVARAEAGGGGAAATTAAETLVQTTTTASAAPEAPTDTAAE